MLPLESQVLAAQLEDTLSVWQRRSTGSYRSQYCAQAVLATHLCDDLITVIGELRDRLRDELLDYQASRSRDVLEAAPTHRPFTGTDE